MTPIERNAYRLLIMVAQGRFQDVDYMTVDYMPLDERFDLSISDLRDAIALLVEQGLIYVEEGLFHGYFRSIELTTAGKIRYQQLMQQQHNKSVTAENAIRTIEEQQKELSGIIKLESHERWIIARERFGRWKAETAKLFSETLSFLEVEKFQKISSSRTGDEMYKCRSFLSALIEELQNHPEDVLSNLVSNSPQVGVDMADKTLVTTVKDPRKVFVIYGRNEKARKALFAFLRSVGLDPKEWGQWVEAIGQGSPYVGEVLKKGFEEAQAFVVLMTPDDEARLREPLRGTYEEPHEINLTPQPRPNVIYEAGMAMGIDEERTILVELGKLRPISDIFGRHVIRINNTPQKRKELAQRLERAGCPVDLRGNDWLEAGNFDAALEGL
jgi:predicted nucleotide-binding protein